jgi:hypothetical protein
MKGSVVLLFALTVAIYHVDGLYSPKCKQAETSEHKLTRMIENANCTLIESGKKLQQGLNHIQLTLRERINDIKSKFLKPKKVPGYEGLDDAIDVRMLPDDDAQTTS